MKNKYKRHWSFVVCDTRYLFPFISLLLLVGISAALFSDEPTQLNRIGNFITGIGVWMSMRHTFREGINRYKNYHDNFAVIPGTNQLNSAFFNNVTFSIGDAFLQVQGFFVVILGSIIGSYSDLIFCFVKNFFIQQ